jgi:hypothetical protein
VRSAANFYEREFQVRLAAKFYERGQALRKRLRALSQEYVSFEAKSALSNDRG